MTLLKLAILVMVLVGIGIIGMLILLFRQWRTVQVIRIDDLNIDISKWQTRIIPWDLPVVDAAFYETMLRMNRSQREVFKKRSISTYIYRFRHGAPRDCQRMESTTGSVVYSIHLLSLRVGLLRFQILPDNATIAYIIAYHASDPEITPLYSQLILSLLKDAVDMTAIISAQVTKARAENETVFTSDMSSGSSMQLAEAITRGTDAATKKGRGRPPEQIDGVEIGQWIRIQEQTRDEDDVFNEFTQKRRLPITTAEDKKLAKRSYRAFRDKK